MISMTNTKPILLLVENDSQLVTNSLEQAGFHVWVEENGKGFLLKLSERTEYSRREETNI